MQPGTKPIQDFIETVKAGFNSHYRFARILPLLYPMHGCSEYLR